MINTVFAWSHISTRISNELGAGNPKGAKLAVRVVVAIVIVEGLMMGSILLGVRNKLGYAFSSDPNVIKYVASMIPIVVAGNFLDGFQCVLSGLSCESNSYLFVETKPALYIYMFLIVQELLEGVDGRRLVLV